MDRQDMCLLLCGIASRPLSKAQTARPQAAHSTDPHRQQRRKETRLGTHKNAVSGQDVLISQRIICRQGIVLVDVVGDQVVDREWLPIKKPPSSNLTMALVNSSILIC